MSKFEQSFPAAQIARELGIQVSVDDVPKLVAALHRAYGTGFRDGAGAEREACALALEALIADHVAGTRKSQNQEDWCAADDNSCEYVVAWADGAEAIRKRGAA